VTSHIPATFLNAPQQVPALQGGHVLGAMTLSGVSLACAIVMLAAWRGSKRLAPLRTPDGAAGWAIFTGSVWMAAGSSWASTATGIASLPTSVLAGGSGGNVGAGGTALGLTLLAFVWPWKRTLVPTVLGIGAAVTYASAGGIWGAIVNAIRLTVGHFTGGA
jgi:hypothetical protein